MEIFADTEERSKILYYADTEERNKILEDAYIKKHAAEFAEWKEIKKAKETEAERKKNELREYFPVHHPFHPDYKKPVEVKQTKPESKKPSQKRKNLHREGRTCNLYFLEFKFYDETCYKVGITSSTLEKRYTRKTRNHIVRRKTITFGSRREAEKAELKIKRENRHNRYYGPNRLGTDGGASELFKNDLFVYYPN